MSARRITGFQSGIAESVYSEARNNLGELCPELGDGAVRISVDPGSLEVSGEITGDTRPYTPEEMAYYLSELGLRVVTPEPSEKS